MDNRPLKVGETFEIEVNQGVREATVLSVVGDEILIEYQMPAGTTALRRWIPGRGWRTCAYRRAPKKFLRDMVARGQTWIGHPQQTAFRAPSPSDLLPRPAPRAPLPNTQPAPSPYGMMDGRTLNPVFKALMRGRWLAVECVIEYSNPAARPETFIELVAVSDFDKDRLYHFGGFSYMNWPTWFRVRKSYDPDDFRDDWDEFDADALEVQFWRDFPPATGASQADGWIAPDGAFYPCGPWEHSSHATAITAVRYGTLQGDSLLELEGWVRLSGGVGATRSDRTATQAQIDVITALAERDDLNPFVREDVERTLRVLLADLDEQSA